LVSEETPKARMASDPIEMSTIQKRFGFQLTPVLEHVQR
jgi:hypothetical protein